MSETIDHHAEAIRLSKLAHDNFDHHDESARARAPFQMQRAQMHATLAFTVEQHRTADAAEHANELKRIELVALIGLSEVNEAASDYLEPGGTLNPDVAKTLGLPVDGVVTLSFTRAEMRAHAKSGDPKRWPLSEAELALSSAVSYRLERAAREVSGA